MTFPTDIVDLFSYLFLYIGGVGLSDLVVKHLLEGDDKYKVMYFGVLVIASIVWFFYSGATIC